MREFLLRHMPPDYSAHGGDIDKMIVDAHWLMLILFVFWGCFFAYALYRFRSGRHTKARYAGLRSTWPLYTVAIVGAVELFDLFGLSIPAWAKWASPLPAMSKPLEVHIIGEQFAWNVHYPGADGIFGTRDIRLVNADNPLGLDPNDAHGKDDIIAVNELHVEVNRPVLVHVTSKDVIHSFKLPVMRAEQDAIPGMDIPIHFTPVRTNRGELWEVACAQLCGLGHYRMRGTLFVDTHDELQKWLSEQPVGASGQ
jgi:cytochrome c oxidase subunit II